jgi:UDP-N-acetylmuramate dehydrogenase
MMDKLSKNLGKSIKENVFLKEFTTFKIGGPAKYFFVAKSEKEIIKAVETAKELGIPYFILGGGSNILVSDNGFDGLVIQIKDSRLKIEDNKIDRVVCKNNAMDRVVCKNNAMDRVVCKNNAIEAGAGVLLQVLVQEAAKAGLSGLERAVGIPGTLGGAIFGNAGDREWGVGDVVKSVKILWPDGKIEVVFPNWIEFDYRESKFKKFPISERPIILSAILELKFGNVEVIKKAMAERIAKREQKIPKEPSAGCIFKNLAGISVGQLIDSLGLKGKHIGDAYVSDIHANFIVNKGNATAKDVKELIELVKEIVKEKKGVQLEEEIQYLGF